MEKCLMPDHRSVRHHLTVSHYPMSLASFQCLLILSSPLVIQNIFFPLNNPISTLCGRSPLAQMEEERREHVAKMKKMEMEMEQVFEMKVKEKVQKLKDSEAEVSIVVAERLLYIAFSTLQISVLQTTIQFILSAVHLLQN